MPVVRGFLVPHSPCQKSLSVYNDISSSQSEFRRTGTSYVLLSMRNNYRKRIEGEVTTRRAALQTRVQAAAAVGAAAAERQSARMKERPAA